MVVLRKLKKSGQFPDEPVKNKSRTNSLCNLPDVLATALIKETAVGDLLLWSALYFRILSAAASLSD
jgi:hypothetical protein